MEAANTGQPASCGRLMRLSQCLNQHLTQPISVLPLVFFRVSYGVILLWESWRYFQFGRIERYYVQPDFFFSYYGFDWITPAPGDGMFFVFHMLGVLSLCLIVGLGYRLVTLLIWLIFTYIFLLDQTQYLNHFYLMSWLCFWLIVLPAHRAFSIEAWLRPDIYRDQVPAWSLYALRGQMTLVYFFGGVAKLNGDWLRAQPMTMWLQERADMPLLGDWLALPNMGWVFSYGGLLLDLLIVPALLWRRTRIPALIVAIGFHLMNAAMFNIGVFPWLAIAATLLFLPPDWFSRLVPMRPARSSEKVTRLHPALSALLIAALVVQVWLPLRHFVWYDNDVNWTEEGHNLAWHMKLRDKDGYTQLYGYADGTLWPIPATQYLTERQASQMMHRPDMVLQFAHYLDQLMPPDYAHTAVLAWSNFSLNGRPAQVMIDPTADLAAQPRDLHSNDWVLPLMQPFSGEPYPTLLLSRRMDDTLILINLTEVAFPLEALSLVAEAGSLAGEQWPVRMLEPDQCLIASTPQTDWMRVYPVCNAIESNLVRDEGEAVWLRDYNIVTQQPAEIICRELTCVVALLPHS